MKLKLTNKLSLPLPILEAIINDDYDPGRSDYTATSLLQPPRMRRLVEMFPDECVEDASELLYRLFGKIIHYILEKAAAAMEAEGYVVEKRFYGSFAYNDRIYVVSAQIDLFDPATGLLSDYKTSSVFAFMKGLKAEHFYQMNLQVELMRREGLAVEQAEIVGIFRDWSGDKADGDKDYPQAPAIKQAVPLILPQEVEAWVVSRLKAHEDAKKAKTQAELPLCTDDEMWAKADQDTFAVTKPGASRATKLCDSKEEAEAFIASKPTAGYVVEARYGKATRCTRYCAARRVCDQWKASPRNPANWKSALKKKEEATDWPTGVPDGLVDA